MSNGFDAFRWRSARSYDAMKRDYEIISGVLLFFWASCGVVWAECACPKSFVHEKRQQ